MWALPWMEWNPAPSVMYYLQFKTCYPLLWYLRVPLNNSVRVHYLTVYLSRSQNEHTLISGISLLSELNYDKKYSIKAGRKWNPDEPLKNLFPIAGVLTIKCLFCQSTTALES